LAAAQAIEGAELVQLEGDRLYALSRASGLSIVDVSNPDMLSLLGQHPIGARPLQMHLHGQVVLGLFADWGELSREEETDLLQWMRTSRVVAFDVQDPENISPVAQYEVAGEVSESWLVGDILYVVSYDNDQCWSCDLWPRDQSAQTVIVSLDLSELSATATVEEVDRLAFEEPWLEESWLEEPSAAWSWTKRSVTRAADRLYVSGPRLQWHDDIVSTIQVVDISDPAGHLFLGELLEIDGMITSPWQLDEHQQILRVITQSRSWGTEGAVPAPPSRIQTFNVVSSQELQHLGQAKIYPLRPRALRAVHFDGDRAYALASGRDAPLLAIDLSDPAKPRQVAALGMPGWVYDVAPYDVAPQGAQLLVLGLGEGDSDGSNPMAMSLFDVSDLSSPNLLDQVSFGGDVGLQVDDLDRLLQAFSVFDKRGLILVSFGGHDRGVHFCPPQYRSGVQLIEVGAKELLLRGLAVPVGPARRAMVHEDRLLALSEERVQAFDITNQDEPTKTAEVPLAMKVYRTEGAGEHVLRFRSDWWTNRTIVEVVDAGKPDTGQPLGSLDIWDELVTQEVVGTQCGPWDFSEKHVFVDGARAYLFFTSRAPRLDQERPSEQPFSVALAIDISVPANPRVTDAVRLDFILDQWPERQGSAQLIDTGRPVVQLGTMIVVQHSSQESTAGDGGQERRTLIELIDFSDSNAIRHAHTLVWSAGLGHTGLVLAGSTVLSSHWRAVDNDPSQVRFYLDRVDLSDNAAPRVLPSVNVPGSLLSYDSSAGRLITVDYAKIVVATPHPLRCREQHWGTARFDPISNRCVRVQRVLQLLDFGERTTRVLAREELDQNGIDSSVGHGGGVSFLVSSNVSPHWGGVGAPVEMTVTTVAPGPDQLVVGRVSHVSDEIYFRHDIRGRAAGEGLLIVPLGRFDVGLVDAAKPAKPTIASIGDLSHSYGYVDDVVVHNGKAFFSLAGRGLEVLDLPNNQ
jgi:hypothetical protein